MTKPYATGFPKCVTWTSTILRVLCWLCPLRWVFLGVSSASLSALPALLASAFDWCQWLSHDECVRNNRRCFVYKSAWEMVDFDKWTGKSFIGNPENGPNCSSRQIRVSMVELRCKNLGLKLDNQQLWILIGLRLWGNICVALTCYICGRVERDCLHGLSCTKSAGRFSGHATLNSCIKQTLGSLHLPSILEPRWLYRTDGKRQTVLSWFFGEWVNSWCVMSRL